MTSTTATTEVESVTVGNGVGFLMTAGMLAKLGVQPGDTVTAQASPTGTGTVSEAGLADWLRQHTRPLAGE